MEFWEIKTPLTEAVTNMWPLYLWGIVGTVGLNIYYSDQQPTMGDDIGMFAQSIIPISLWAGITEEIIYRWLMFLMVIVTIQATDWILLGFADLHMIQWLIVNITAPVSNFLTLGFLEPYLLNTNWAVGAAVIVSCHNFQKGHAHQGTIGYLNSWFMGMCFFWVMFNHGIIVAMLAHVIYDIVVFSTLYTMMAIREQRLY